MNMTKQRGDTIIEVLVAIVVLSTVLVISYGIMTRGFANGQIALERTETQAMLNAQATILRTVRDTSQSQKEETGVDTSEWSAVLNLTRNAPASGIPASAVEGCSHPTNAQFYFQPSAANPMMPIENTTQLVNSSYIRIKSFPTYGDGMWVEGYKVSTAGSQVYYDFYIKSCWYTPYGGDQQMMRTTVRLYETR